MSEVYTVEEEKFYTVQVDGIEVPEHLRYLPANNIRMLRQLWNHGWGIPPRPISGPVQSSSARLYI